MSTSLATLIRLRAIQNKTRQLFAEMNDLQYRLQYHHDLSPAGWHLGHGLFIENYWLHEIIQGNSKHTRDDSLFIPQNCPKPERGPRLPPREELLSMLQKHQDENALMLMEMIPPLSEHPLFKDEYIENFIIQHYAQHYETLHMVLTQMAIKNDKGNYEPETILQPQVIDKQYSRLPGAQYEVGGAMPYSYDNELPAHHTKLDAFSISTTPVNNSEFLNFILDNGYQNRELWSEPGWQWKTENNISHPDHWAQNKLHQWYGLNHDGAYTLQGNTPVHGLSYYEAEAFANFAEARLPHEHEWETAVRKKLLTDTACTWEWCNNTFYAYDGYEAFPYLEYSAPWFDGNHYVLRGASQYTRPDIKRASFRNFYQPHQRHIFAGMRLAQN